MGCGVDVSNQTTRNVVKSLSFSRTVFEIEDERSVGEYIDEEFVQSMLKKAMFILTVL